jgi:xanthine dehydrogenase YagR molybdenum-binding subunit
VLVAGIGEAGLVGVAAAIANAVFRGAGRRIRSLPITIDLLLWPLQAVQTDSRRVTRDN